jgi:putative membrane protein
MMKNQKYPVLFTMLSLLILIVSGLLAHDKFTWVLEVFPIILGLPVSVFTYRRFKFTNLVYVLLIIHFIILAVGGIYTYAKVPLGFWMQDWFHFTRNNYDKIGHFAQGFIPAIIARELVLRTSPLNRGKWLSFIVVSICFAISAFYELVEWWTSLAQGASAEAFLGTQGDEWDAQSDMFVALIGAVLALVSLSPLHNKLLRKYN